MMLRYQNSSIFKVFNIYEVRQTICEITNPHDLASLFRALDLKPRNIEYKRYLNVINYIFKSQKLMELINNEECRVVIFGKDVQSIKNHINVNSIFWYDEMYYKNHLIYCIILCSTNHAHHRLQRIIQQDCRIMVRIIEFNIPSILHERSIIEPNFEIVPSNNYGVVVCISLHYISNVTKLLIHTLLHEFAYKLPNLHSTSYITNSDNYWDIETSNDEYITIKQDRNFRISDSGKINTLILFSRYESYDTLHFFNGYRFSF